MGKLDVFRVHIALTDEQIETIVDLGPYTLLPDGAIESCDGVSLTNCRPNHHAVECEWDRALVALLNEVAACKRTPQ